jgi:hypothetical protein
MTPVLFAGVDFDAMIVGLMSASFITFWLETVDDLPKAASAVLFSGMLSAFGAPVATAYLTNKFQSLSGSGNALPLLTAVIIGGSVTWGLPILINFVRNRWGNGHV